MQIAYFDCFSGISGDMTLAALIDAGADIRLVQAGIDSMDLAGVHISTSHTMRRGFRGKLLSIEHPREHAHRYLRDIHALIRRARISSAAKDLAMRFFERIARAEAKVHGTSIDRVQFHEVGAVDSIVDMVGVAIAWDELQIDKAYASAVPTGAGQIQIAHGTVSVPAPATAELLVGVPIAATQIAFEMTTPTGAAIVTELASDFGAMPPMQVGRIGYGAGKRDIPDRPNLLRVLLGTALKAHSVQGRPDDSVVVLECNLDDITGEQLGFALERLWSAGALDVFTIPIQMKKNRPGILLSVLAKPEDRHALESVLFQHTGTLGVRYRKQSRSVLPRACIDVQTPWGVIAGKVSKLPTGEVNFSPEHDDCSAIAVEYGLRLSDVVEEVEECYFAQLDNSPVLTDAGHAQGPDGSVGEIVATPEALTNIESVNAVFREAAFEDEYGSAAPSMETTAMETVAMEATGLETIAVEKTKEMEVGPREEAVLEHNHEYYRWDSSPWSHEVTSPLPPTSVPREFPLQRPWES